MKLKRYGFFRELAHGDEDGDSLSALRDAAPYDNITKEQIVKYLVSGQIYMGCPGTVADVLADDAVTPVASPDILTDGEWAWPGDLAYYVSRYNVPIPQQMFEVMKRNAWHVPQNLDVTALEL